MSERRKSAVVNNAAVVTTSLPGSRRNSAPAMEVLKPVPGDAQEKEAKPKAEAQPKPEPKTETKPEIRPEAQPETVSQPKPKTLEDIKEMAQNLYYLAEQHNNLLAQLEKLRQFAAEVGENASLRLTSDGKNSFSSSDSGAVAKMIEFCTESLKAKIADIESKLVA